MQKIFISHSNIDRGVASELVSVLEGSGISCWIAPRDISPGTSWPEAIATAIQETSAMILLLSQNTNESVQVIREVEHAVNQRKVLIPIRIEEVWL